MSDVVMQGWGFKFLLTLPLVWLILVAFLDKYKDLNALFYSKTLKRIYEQETRIRNGCNVQQENCPIFKALIAYLRSSHTAYAKEVGRIPTIKILKDDISDSENHCVIWSLLRGMTINYQQAAFFEVIVIQFFIAFLALDAGLPLKAITPYEWNVYIKYIYLAITIFFFLVPWLVQTYIFQENASSYSKIEFRIALLIFTWIILMLL